MAPFTSPHYVDDERNYKLEAAAKLTELLSAEQMQDWIAAGEFEEAKVEIKRASQGRCANILCRF